MENMRGKSELSEKDYKYLYRYSHDLNYWTRFEVAELLCNHYTPEAERVLRRLTYDLHYIVRLNAIDSLCIGRTKKSLKRLYRLTKSRDELIRMYAYMSTNDIINNRNIASEKQSYLMWVQSAIRKDPSNKVRISMYGELYKMGIKKAFAQLEKEVKILVEKQETGEVWLVLNVLEGVIEGSVYSYEKLLDMLNMLRRISNQKQLEKIDRMIK